MHNYTNTEHSLSLLFSPPYRNSQVINQRRNEKEYAEQVNVTSVNVCFIFQHIIAVCYGMG